jgi:hypothetical protein
MNDPLPLNKATWDKEVVKAAKPNPAGTLAQGLETWRKNQLKSLQTVQNVIKTKPDVLHLWALAQAHLSGATTYNLDEILSSPEFSCRLSRWYDETQLLCGQLGRLKRNDLGQLIHFL